MTNSNDFQGCRSRLQRLQDSFEWTQAYIDLPYERLNCWELVCLVYEHELGIHLPSYRESYVSVNESEELDRLIRREKLGWIRCEEPEIMDLALLRIRHLPTHIGVVVTPSLILSTRRKTGSLIEDLKTPFWKNRIEGYFRYWEFDS